MQCSYRVLCQLDYVIMDDLIIVTILIPFMQMYMCQMDWFKSIMYVNISNVMMINELNTLFGLPICQVHTIHM